MSYFRGKRAAVTGAASGIGRALAQRLHGEGCEVFLADIDAEGLEETRHQLDGAAPCHLTQLDVADATAVDAWANEVAAGGDALDLLVNNAGVGLIGSAAQTSLEDLRWLMGINFHGVVHGCRAFLPLLENSPRGHLVNLSSIFGIIAVPTQSAYNASKFAVRGYTEALRQDLAAAGSRVQVCCVHPGGIATDIARRARNADRSVSGDEQHARFEAVARTSPDAAAAAILKAARRGRPRLLIGADARWIDRLQRLFPGAYPRLLSPLLPAELN